MQAIGYRLVRRRPGNATTVPTTAHVNVKRFINKRREATSCPNIQGSLNCWNFKDTLGQGWMRPLCEGTFFWFGKCCLSLRFHESSALHWVIWQRALVPEVIHFPHGPAKVSWSWMCRATSLGKVWWLPSCSVNTSRTCGNRTGSILFPEWALEVWKAFHKDLNFTLCSAGFAVAPRVFATFRWVPVLPVILDHDCMAASCQFDLLKVALWCRATNSSLTARRLVLFPRLLLVWLLPGGAAATRFANPNTHTLGARARLHHRPAFHIYVWTI